MSQSFDDVWGECEDLFSQARQTLATLKEPQPAHVVQASVNALFRTTHTLKGMAGMLGYSSFSRAAHRMEDIFDLMRKGRLRSTDSLTETLEAGMEALESGLASLRRGAPEPEDYLYSLRRQLGELEAMARPSEGGTWDLSSMLDISPEALKALSEYERTRVTSLLMDGTPIYGVTICLDFATFDERLRVLADALSAQGELISTLPWDVPEDRDGLLQVQKDLLQMRMVKVDSLFARIEPMVKNLSRDTGKSVKLAFYGGDLELERNLLGRMTEPFLHLIRNALDHGLESPSERLAQGKSEAGSLRISASQRGRNLRFDIRDDGRGFDLARIEARGLALGLIKAHEKVSSAQLYRLTLEPGFSTKEQPSQLSGRGVGMDVVRSEIDALGGEIHISSEDRRGSLIRLSLPLSRAVVTCLKVRCDGHTFGIPIGSVLRVKAGRQFIRGGDHVEVHGMSIPMESLQACLGLPEPDGQRAFVVLTQQGASARSVELAIGVDDVEGRSEVLLRSLPELAQSPGIMGGSPQEDGILWLLDPEAILGLAMDSLMRRVAHV